MKSALRSADSEIRIGWNWVWFAPLSLFLLYFVEAHTIPFGLAALKLAMKRWNWGGLISPSLYFCSATITCSVIYPIYGLIFALASLGTGQETPQKRYFKAALLLAVVAILPIITDTLIWGSFPFTFDNLGVGRLRIIPFLPWPTGGYMAF